jgi:hypothetical protein
MSIYAGLDPNEPQVTIALDFTVNGEPLHLEKLFPLDAWDAMTVEDYLVVAAGYSLERDYLKRAAYEVVVKSLGMVLRRFAQAHAAHPDFQPAWRIDG